MRVRVKITAATKLEIKGQHKKGSDIKGVIKVSTNLPGLPHDELCA